MSSKINKTPKGVIKPTLDLFNPKCMQQIWHSNRNLRFILQCMLTQLTKVYSIRS